MSLWDARFQKTADQRLNDFNSSIESDKCLFEDDIKGSIAHVMMLAKQNIITEADKAQMVDCLNTINKEIKNGELIIDPLAEDIHMFIETQLTKRIQDAGKRMHTARSRNDQVALDMRLFCSRKVKDLQQQLIQLEQVLCKLASQHLSTIMPGYTHLQRAQPITLGHYLMAYAQMFFRDLQRLSECQERIAISPLGCGALATSTFPIDREFVKEQLGMQDISQNSLDGVSDRDFCIEIASNLSLIMMHLSRFSEEIILWCSWEFQFMELDDAFATGSSLMPQKKNPDICELIRGKSGRVYGDLINLLVMMKGLPLAYNKDMQEDKDATFDALNCVSTCLETFIPMLSTAVFKPDMMRKAANEGFINATDCADYLVKKEMPFRDAYQVVGRIIQYAQTHKKTLETITLSEYQQFSMLFKDDVYEAIGLDRCVEQRNVIGGPAKKEVTRQIAKIKKALEAFI